MTLSDKTILIPGGGGYIGQALIEVLKKNGARIKTMGAKAVIESRWRNWLYNTDAIIYLAAQTDAHWANQNPYRDIYYSVIPFLKMLTVISQMEKKEMSIIFAGAVTQVGYTNSVKPTKLTQRDRPITVYDIHKLTCEHYLRFFCRDYGLKGVTLRLANVYGPSSGESTGPRGFLNRMVKAAVKGQGIEVFTGLVRDYVYIDDVVAAILTCLDHPELMNGQSYEIGSGAGYDIASVADLIGELVYGVEIEKVPVPVDIHPIEARSFVCNIEPFVAATDWRPQIQIREGLERTIKFYG
jgi:nucleoside-diphosphate-sugar epimerase